MTSLAKLFERCWSATSKLESQVLDNPDLPKAYSQVASESFDSLRALGLAIGWRKDGPWRISGKTEDERMYKISNSDGFVVCHVYGEDSAQLIVAISQMWSRS